MNIDNCYIIDIPKFCDDRGCLSFVESNNHVAFSIKRVYYLYNIPDKEKRGAHAHKNLHQLIIAISGQFIIQIDDGFKQKDYKLDKPNIGMYICPRIWRNLSNFSNDAVCLVLASEAYCESDYIRDYDEFMCLNKK